MSAVGEREIRTQQRVIAFLTDTLGYAYLGHWQERVGNSNIEERLLNDWLSNQGHSNRIIRKAIEQCQCRSKFPQLCRSKFPHFVGFSGSF